MSVGHHFVGDPAGGFNSAGRPLIADLDGIVDPMIVETSGSSFGSFYPLLITRQQLFNLEFKYRTCQISGFAVYQTVGGSGLPAPFTGIGSVTPFERLPGIPTGPTELLSWPGLSRSLITPDFTLGTDTGELLSLRIGLTGSFGAPGDFTPDGTFPLKCPSTVFPTYFAESGSPVNQVASNHTSNGSWPFIYFQLSWAVGADLYSITTYDGWTPAGQDRDNTGHYLHVFDWGTVPLFLLRPPLSDMALTDDIYLDEATSFSY